MEQAIKSIFFEQIVKAVISKIIIAVPFLGWPIINQIFTGLVYKLAKMFIKEMETLSVFIKIDFEVDGQRREYEKATEEMKEALKNPQSYENLQKAKDEYREKLRNLIMLNNS